MKKILKWDDLGSLNLVVQSVKNNELIVGTTDTILGLFAPVSPEGKLLLDTVKKRDTKPYIVLLSEKKIKEVCVKNVLTDTILYSIIEKFWPGPLTIIVDTHQILKEGIISETTVAIRVPAHAGIQRLLEKVEMVFSTSANTSGMPAPASLNEIEDSFIQVARYIIVDDHHIGVPSTIIKYNKNNVVEPITIIREGAISREKLAAISPHLHYLMKKA